MIRRLVAAISFRIVMVGLLLFFALIALVAPVFAKDVLFTDKYRAPDHG